MSGECNTQVLVRNRKN